MPDFQLEILTYYWTSKSFFMQKGKLNLLVFSGAGMSAESGISTFRDSDGLWEQHRIEEVATPEAWKADPDLVTRFYNARRKQIIAVQPNAAHLHIARMESQFNVQVITQNIDDLHERAGSAKVLHLHGNIRYAKSSGPNAEAAYYPIEGWELTAEDRCPDGFRLRPHVVWFGEAVPAYDQAVDLLRKADILLVIGTSLQVYPAAGLIYYAPSEALHILVDPKAETMDLPSHFHRVKGGAVEGIELAEAHIKKVLGDQDFSL
jgi:NAD-dependent deacetylase